MDAAREAERIRRSAGVFALEGRGVLAVRGGDRVRWLNGMITNDVAKLAPGPAASGCHALLLTRQGRIAAELHVLLRSDELWLEMPRDAVTSARERLAKLVIADDVDLVERSDEIARFGVEGAQAVALVADALEAPASLAELAPEACLDARIAGADAVVAAFGWSGAPGLQLFVPAAARDAVRGALVDAAARCGAVMASAGALEVLRVEAGVPRMGAELSEEVLPPEARLEGAISHTKGCYTGQEVIARLRSRGQVAHLLVGIAPEDGKPLAAGSAIEAGAERVGEVTSAVVSGEVGPIALGYVRRAQAEPGTVLAVAGRGVRVRALPFLPSGPAGA